MTGRLDRVLAAWKRALDLAWPVSVQQGFNTLMRTVDVIVTGLISPAAVAAVGLSDLYARLPLNVGLGLGSGAIALSSQDTGRGARASRDEVVSQALVIGFLIGLPFVVGGLLLNQLAISSLGAERDVVRLGGSYLAIIMVVAPARIVGIVGSRSLQGAGDTRTPMYVGTAGNLFNIAGTVTLGLGLGPVPAYGVVGVGASTAAARVFVAAALVGVIVSGRTGLGLTRPRDLTVTRQLVEVGTPNMLDSFSLTVAYFPFNALLLVLGTEVNAAYHVGRRLHQQLAGPLYRAYGTVASIVVGQSLGAGEPEEARYQGFAIAALGAVSLGAVGLVLLLAADPLVGLFTRDATTARHGADFAQAHGLVEAFVGVAFCFSGALRGAGDTRTPLVAHLTGVFGFMLGFSYLAGFMLDYGLVGIYAGIGLSFVVWSVLVAASFTYGHWVRHATDMMAQRAGVGTDEPSES